MKSICIEHHKKYFLVELNFSMQKWLVISSNNPNKPMTHQGCLEVLGKEIDSNDSESTRIIFCKTATKC